MAKINDIVKDELNKNINQNDVNPKPNSRIIFLEWDQCISREPIKEKFKIDVLETWNDKDFLNYYFGENEEDYKLFQTICSEFIHSNYLFNIIYKEDLGNNELLYIISRYFKIMGTNGLSNFFSENNIHPQLKNDKINIVESILNKMNIKPAPNVYFIGTNITEITHMKDLGLTCYHVDNSYRNPLGLYYNDFVKIGLLTFRKSSSSESSESLYSYKEEGDYTYKTERVEIKEYLYQKKKEISQEGTDPILLEEFDNHPYGTFYLPSSVNNKIIYKPFNTKSLLQWFLKSQTNPLTREIVSRQIINRVNVFYNIYKNSPNITFENMRSNFKNFIQKMRNGIIEDDMWNQLAFITPQFMIDEFNEFYENPISGRIKSEEILKDKPIGTWVLRPTSLMGDIDNIPFVLSVKKEKIIMHIAFLMRKSYGIADVSSKIKSGQVVMNINSEFTYETLYQVLISFDLKKCIYFDISKNDSVNF